MGKHSIKRNDKFGKSEHVLKKGSLINIFTFELLKKCISIKKQGNWRDMNTLFNTLKSKSGLGNIHVMIIVFLHYIPFQNLPPLKDFVCKYTSVNT